MPASASACHESAKPPRLPLQREKGCLLKQLHREPGSTEMHPHPLADTVRVMEVLGIANGAGNQAKASADQSQAGQLQSHERTGGKDRAHRRAAALPAVSHGARLIGTALLVIRSYRVVPGRVRLLIHSTGLGHDQLHRKHLALCSCLFVSHRSPHLVQCLWTLCGKRTSRLAQAETATHTQAHFWRASRIE